MKYNKELKVRKSYQVIHNKFGETMFEKFMWGVFPYIFWIMFLGILLVFFIKVYLMIFYPRFIGEWNAELLAPIIEKIKE